MARRTLNLRRVGSCERCATSWAAGSEAVWDSDARPHSDVAGLRAVLTATDVKQRTS